jgi:quercetin dioxygenase-like cupin family protein
MRASSPDRGGVVETRAGTMFTGVVWGEVQLPHDSGAGVNRVTFAPRSRTFWHRHLGGQMLLGVAGSGLVATRDAAVGIGDGAVVHAFAGELHWHGALPDSFMTHVSVVLSGTTEWLEEVSDEDYLAAVEKLKAGRLPGGLWLCAQLLGRDLF